MLYNQDGFVYFVVSEKDFIENNLPNLVSSRFQYTISRMACANRDLEGAVVLASEAKNKNKELRE